MFFSISDNSDKFPIDRKCRWHHHKSLIYVLQNVNGIVDQSQPERELQETIEKLSCLSQYIFTHATKKIGKTTSNNVTSTPEAM